MITISATIGPSFSSEYEAASPSLMGLPVLWHPDGVQYDETILTSTQVTQLQALIAAHDPTRPAPPPVTVVAKVDLFRRMTDAEYASMQSSLGQQPPRTQAIFNGADTFRSDAPEWPTLQQMALQLYGADRAGQLLAPS